MPPKGSKPPQSALARKDRQRANERAIDRRKCADPRRRKRLEKSPCDWLRHYMPAAFPLKWSAGHRAIIDGAVQAAKSGTGEAVAAPRGEGKTTLLRAMSLYLMAIKVVRFPVMAGWTHKAAGEAYRLWLRMLHSSPEFCADYPELTQPFEESIHAARLRSMWWRDGDACGAEVRSTDRSIVLPDSIGAIAAASVQGDIKGLSIQLPNGETLRPDLLLIDDAQDPRRADNPSFVRDVVDLIEKQWMCLAGPQARITTMVACTVAAANDVSEHFLERPDFHSIRVSRVEAWPDTWDDRDSPARKVWDEWHETLLDGLRNNDGGKAGVAFYRKRKAEMTARMRVSWSERYDAKRGDPDALYSAMFDLYRIGENAFASEYQNRPRANSVMAYDVTPQLVQSRVSGFDRLTAPAGATFICAAADVNFPGLNWTLMACRKDAAGWIADWNKWPSDRDMIDRKRSSGKTEDQAVAEAIVALARHLDALRVVVGGKPAGPDVLGIDVGYMTETVLQTIATLRLPMRVMGVRGRDAKKFRVPKDAVRFGEGWFVQDWKAGRVVVVNVDHWREQMQRAFLLEPGAPGSLSLYGTDPRAHDRLAAEITANRLKERVVTGLATYYNWTKQPGVADDLGDAATYAYALANMAGATAGRSSAQPEAREMAESTASAQVVRPSKPLPAGRVAPRLVPRVAMEW